MTVLENEISRKKITLGSYYEEAKKAIAAQNIEQAIDLTERGRIQAELENDYEWVQRFNSFNSAIKKKPLLSTTIMKEDITKIKGVGPSVAQKLREHGFDTIETLARSTIPQLSSIKGIGPATAHKIVEGAKSLTSRKKLNDFPQPDDKPEETPVHEEVEEYNQEDYNTIIKEMKPHKESGNPQTMQQMSPTIHEEIVDFEEAEEFKDEDEFIEIPDVVIRSPKFTFIEGDPLEVKEIKFRSRQKQKTIQDEKLDISERRTIENQVVQIFQKYDYNIIKPTPLLKDIFTHADVVAVKKADFNDVLDFVIIIPLKLNTLKGELQVSSETIKYVPNHQQFKENGSAFKMLLDSYFDTIQESHKTIHHDLINKGNFHSYIKRHFGINITIKKTLTRKNLFFTEGNMQLKMLIEPVLLCQNDVGFLEKDIPFAYLNDINLHIIKENNLSDFVHFIEQKYILLETHRKQNHSLISYNESYDQFLKRSTILSIPFIGFGVVLLFLILFQSFETMKFLINIGYALLGVFFISIPFFYMKVLKPRLEIQAEFLNPYSQKESQLDETSLILINEKFSPEMMSQFGYECLGKHHQSKVIMQIEQDQIKESIDKNRLLTKVKNGGFFEEEIPEKNKDFINRYGSFLED
ncbi:hypothetical protein ES705_11624 [subsurface metagenome]